MAKFLEGQIKALAGAVALEDVPASQRRKTPSRKRSSGKRKAASGSKKPRKRKGR